MQDYGKEVPYKVFHVKKLDGTGWYRVYKNNVIEEQIADFFSKYLAEEYCRFKNGQ